MALFVTGVDMAHYALLKEDPTNLPGAASPALPEYGPVVSLIDLREVGVNSADAFSAVYADNAPKATVSSKSEKTLALTRFSFSEDEKVAILGWFRNALGAIFETASSLPPYLALGFRIEYNDGTYLYVWLFKGKIAINASTAQTRETTVSPQFAPAVGTFVARNCDNAFQTMRRGDAAFAAIWFTQATLQTLMEPADTGSGGSGGSSVTVQNVIVNIQPTEEMLKADADAADGEAAVAKEIKKTKAPS